MACPAWEKCYSSQYSWVRAQGARRSPWYFRKGGTACPLALAGEQEFSETNADSAEPRGRRGLLPSYQWDPLPVGRNGNRTWSSQRGRKGEQQPDRAGARAAGSVHQRGQGGDCCRPEAPLPAEGRQLKAGVTSPCPCPYSPGPRLFSAVCFGILPGHRILLLLPSLAL